MIRKLLNWFKYLFKGKEKANDTPDVKSSGRIIKFYSYRYLDDEPDTVEDYTLYLIGHENYYWKAIMKCPCGCEKDLHMNLMTDYYPFWNYTINEHNEISLKPSVDRMVGCKSHFFLRNGRIQWAVANTYDFSREG